MPDIFNLSTPPPMGVWEGTDEYLYVFFFYYLSEMEADVGLRDPHLRVINEN